MGDLNAKVGAQTSTSDCCGTYSIGEKKNYIDYIYIANAQKKTLLTTRLKDLYQGVQNLTSKSRTNSNTVKYENDEIICEAKGNITAVNYINKIAQ